MSQKTAQTAQQTIGKRKTSVAVAKFSKGTGDIRLNGVPIELVRPELLKSKVLEPLFVAGLENYKNMNIQLSAMGGGYIAQLYAIRQAIAKAIIANTHDDVQKETLRKAFVKYDRHLIVADTRRCEEKKFGGRGARARRQKSYR
ncbi:Ribosomal_protein S16 [Hexamita inflata]|uniref:Ribosomal protein S16 n=1 Tax=Hexamita inflata TaxID=28002 RepID=A0AA86QX41_9EUKA|nr:Ribosomal protein S16 [Hexamita inflata]